MRIDYLRVENFRCFVQEAWEFAPGFNVFIGDNGSGKTAILNALSIAVGTYFVGVDGLKSPGIKEDDSRFVFLPESDSLVRNHFYPVSITFCPYIFNEVMQVERYRNGDNGRTFYRGDAEFKAGVKRKFLTMSLKSRVEFLNLLESEPEKFNREIAQGRAEYEMALQRSGISEDQIFLSDNDLPLISAYSAGRAWLKGVKKRLNFVKPVTRTKGYEACLDAASDEEFLFDWFKTREAAGEQSGGVTETVKGIRAAVVACLGEEWEQIWYDINQGEIMAKRKEGSPLPIRLLSDGQRSVLAMGLDMAYRAAVLNPHLAGEAAQKTPGVVLIDELDLHLHPNWQRTIVPNLRRAFPKVQFFVTTHSPIIIQSLDPEKDKVIDLSKETEFPLTERSSPEDILQRMGVEIPQQSAKWLALHKTAKEYYDLLDEAKETRDETRLAELRARLDALSIPFEENPAWAALLERKRVAAGIDPEEAEA